MKQKRLAHTLNFVYCFPNTSSESSFGASCVDKWEKSIDHSTCVTSFNNNADQISCELMLNGGYSTSGHRAYLLEWYLRYYFLVVTITSWLPPSDSKNISPTNFLPSLLVHSCACRSHQIKIVMSEVAKAQFLIQPMKRSLLPWRQRETDDEVTNKMLHQY